MLQTVGLTALDAVAKCGKAVLFAKTVILTE